MTEARLFSVEREQQILEDIKEPVTELIEQHEVATKDWDPADFIPYNQARTYSEDQPWSPGDYPLDDRYRDALYVNLATEDNLPKYFEEINSHAPAGHPLGYWANLWTFEESRHVDLIANWARATRALDPKQLMEERKQQMLHGESPHAPTSIELFAYASLQELATAVSHRGVIPFLDKEHGGQRAMGRIARDEQHHYDFYSGALKAALQVDPSAAMMALDRQLRHFAMPGKEGIKDFEERSATMDQIGVYGLRLHLNKVVEPTLNLLEIDSVTRMDDSGEYARQRIHRYHKILSSVVMREAQSSRS